MADDKLAELLQSQKSLTEWLQDINHVDTAMLRQEDNTKRDRLKVLHDEISLPFDEPVQFEASEIKNKSTHFKEYFAEHANELCAIRLLPKTSNLPKLRMRGKTVRDAIVWFNEQSIDAQQYKADLIPHPASNTWATIFIVNNHGIQGEIIAGGHHQLTQGFHDKDTKPCVFRYDFTKWYIEPANDAALLHVQKLATYLYIKNGSMQRTLGEKLAASFTHNYLNGYFETTDSEMGTWFIDYSPSLGDLYKDLAIKPHNIQPKAIVHGQIGCAGQAIGPICIVDIAMLDTSFPEGGILVCDVTTPLFVPLMQRAAGIVTNQGGILSHAAIVARELHIPCIVGTNTATTLLANVGRVHVDADNGDVMAISDDRFVD